MSPVLGGCWEEFVWKTAGSLPATKGAARRSA